MVDIKNEIKYWQDVFMRILQVQHRQALKPLFSVARLIGQIHRVKMPALVSVHMNTVDVSCPCALFFTHTQWCNANLQGPLQAKMVTS